jgi:hypothetical protein
MDECEQIASHPTHVLCRDREHRARGNGRVDRAASSAQERDARRRCEMVNAANHAVYRVSGDEWCERGHVNP